jgi:hypothetical protein
MGLFVLRPPLRFERPRHVRGVWRAGCRFHIWRAVYLTLLRPASRSAKFHSMFGAVAGSGSGSQPNPGCRTRGTRFAGSGRRCR